jgi:hypothetical protein
MVSFTLSMRMSLAEPESEAFTRLFEVSSESVRTLVESLSQVKAGGGFLRHSILGQLKSFGSLDSLN